MIYRKIKIEEFKTVKNLYKEVIAKSKTYGWGDNYPSDQMILDDLNSNSLVGLFDNDKLIAVSFIGNRHNPDYIDFWMENLINPARWTRICIHPDYQGQGIGKYFTNLIVNNIKQLGYDGIRILVAKENIAAIKLYDKFGFKNCGQHHMENLDWYCYELKF